MVQREHVDPVVVVLLLSAHLLLRTLVGRIGVTARYQTCLDQDVHDDQDEAQCQDPSQYPYTHLMYALDPMFIMGRR